MSRKKTEIYQTFLASLKGGGVYPQFGKTPNYFRFFLVKASLNVTHNLIISHGFSAKGLKYRVWLNMLGLLVPPHGSL